VEFIVDGKRNFYFLEMNTRLQVEHPVTELVTGIDLVEQMIRVAAGEELELKQQDVKLEGWAIESRLYAEDPFRNFLPSIGRLTRYRPPQEGEQPDKTVLRNDTGVYEGGEISMYYDPMIAKLCSWGKDRITAIDAMAQALDDFEVDGIGHNLPFLSAVMGHVRFRQGNITTAFIADEFPDGFKGVAPPTDDLRDFASIAAFIHVTRENRSGRISGAMENHRRVIGEDWIVSIAGKPQLVRAEAVSDGLRISLDGEKAQLVASSWTPGQAHGRFRIGARDLSVKIYANGVGIRLRRRGMEVLAHVRSPRVAELAVLMPVKQAKDTSKLLLCPMPGMIRLISVSAGDTVEAGQPLAIVEAMKMENVLRAERHATVKRIAATVGDSLAVDQLIMEFD
jgi:propionyl-CoA carboxylase alpha chain